MRLRLGLGLLHAPLMCFDYADFATDGTVASALLSFLHSYSRGLYQILKMATVPQLAIGIAKSWGTELAASKIIGLRHLSELYHDRIAESKSR